MLDHFRYDISGLAWQVIITSDNCALKQHSRGWQIFGSSELEPCFTDHERWVLPMSGKVDNVCPKTEIERCNADEDEFCNVKNKKLSGKSVMTSVTTAHTTTSCHSSDFQECCEEDSEKSENGSILFKEYLKLLVNGDARLNFITRLLSQAIQDRKTFVICGHFPLLRKPLMGRGWLEKRTVRKMMSLAPQSNVGGLEQVEKLLRNSVTNLIWYTSKHSPTFRVDERTMVNKFSGCYFTSKVDMCNNLENVYWFYESGVSNIQFPRCYNIYRASQMKDFKADYRITACLGILKWFLFIAKITGPQSVWKENGKVPVSAVLFALERCTEFIRRDYREVPVETWDQFLDSYYKIIHGYDMLKKNLKIDIDVSINECVNSTPHNPSMELLAFADNILIAVSKFRLQEKLDGMRDIWILKPSDKSLGKGIVLIDRLSDILNKLNLTAREGMQYVVQKYIERPLLVYNKKIDVRQWFLITSTHPLVVWMYRDILIRFASRDFTLDDFHESIHLCNTMVQIKYRTCQHQESRVPKELHWNLEDFKNYLKGMNQEFAWDKIILPGIKQNLIGALLASQENMANQKNSFQLYGADFVIMDDFSVWLIEINTNPRLYPPSSAVTSKLYPEIVEDIVKGEFINIGGFSSQASATRVVYCLSSIDVKINVHHMASSLVYTSRGIHYAEPTFLVKGHVSEFEDTLCSSQTKPLETHA
ncbi:tubulin glycylase 3A-like [Diprion similis]|uniref:tubulin glycylase 3A-like n=1 Tax=Diprion similis TaxID=362088 RepID=UPI001EF959A2|nr:tubulin glycylase 3A-like [Diprion similis]